MSSVNKFIGIGRVGSDPEVRTLESGSIVAKFSIAMSDKYTDKNGQTVENTLWMRVELWEGLAKVADKYIKKGGQIYVEGKLKEDKWTDKDGVERSAISVRGNSLTLLGGAPNNPTAPNEGLTNGAGNGSRSQPNTPAAPKPSPAQNRHQAEFTQDESDDLPF